MNNSFQSISTTIEIADLHLNVSQRISVFGANIKVNSFQQNLWRDWNFQTLDVGVFWATFLEHVGVCQAPKHANGAATIPPGDTPPLKWFCNSWVCRFTKTRKSCHKEYQRPQSRWCDKRDTTQWYFPRFAYIYFSYVFITGMGFSPRISMNFPIFSWVFSQGPNASGSFTSQWPILSSWTWCVTDSHHTSVQWFQYFTQRPGKPADSLSFWMARFTEIRNPKECVQKRKRIRRCIISQLYRFNYGWLWKYYNINDMRYFIYS